MTKAREIAAREKFSGLIVQGFIDLGIQLFTQVKIEMALVQFNNAIAEARRVYSPFQIARSQYWAGRSMTLLGQNPVAEAVLNEAEAYYRTNHFPREALRVKINLANVAANRNEMLQANKIVLEVQHEAAVIGDKLLLMESTMRIAENYRILGNYPGALENLEIWLKSAASGQIIADVCIAEIAIARALTNLGRFVEARQMIDGQSKSKRLAKLSHFSK